MLRPDAVDAIFGKLLTIYGTRFTSSYQGQDMASVRNSWATELSGLSDAQVKHALSQLPPEFPPTVLGFRLLARSMPPPYKALPAPEAPMASTEVRERANERMQAVRTQLLQGRGGVEWAFVVLEKVRTGVTPRPTRTAIEMAQRALRSRGLLGTDGTPADEATE